MLRLLGLKDFSFIWGAGVLSLLGTWILLAALPFYVYRETGSALATGTMFLAGTIPMAVFGPLGGAVADQFNRRTVMVASDLVRALLILTLLTLLITKAVWPLYVVEFLESGASLAFGPAQGALLPQIVPSEMLVRANSLWRVSDNLARLIGPSVGGALLAVGGLGPVIVADVLSYVLSAALISRLSTTAGGLGRGRARRGAPLCSLYKDLWEGVCLFWRQAWLIRLGAGNSCAMLAQGILNVLLVVFVHVSLRAGAAAFGGVISAQGIGGLLGSLLIIGVPRLTSTLRPSRMFSLSLIGMSAIVIVMFLFPSLPTTITLMAALGLPVTAWLTSFPALIQMGTTDEFRGRIFGVLGTLQAVSLLVSEGLAGLLQHVTGTMPLLYSCGGLLALGGVVSWGVRPPPSPAKQAPLDGSPS